MLSQSLAVLAAAATAVLAKTPPGFEPASENDLIVIYGNTVPQNGVVTTKDATANQPTIGTTTKLSGASYAVIMIDLDIPGSTPGTTNTFLHWLQPGFAPSTTATTVTTASGPQQIYMLVAKNATQITPYRGPNPPAKAPLSHIYTQILVDTTAIPSDGLATLRAAASANNGVGFDALATLTKAGLADKVVAGNFYNVTNGGSGKDANTTTPGVAAGTGSLTSPTSPAGAVPVAGLAAVGLPNVMGAVLLALGSVFFAL